MKYLASGSEMQQIDNYTINEIGIPALVLMERAALGVTEEIEKHFTDEEGTPIKDKGDINILVVTENGNNGGDGLAAARQLISAGFNTDIYNISEVSRATESFQAQKGILEKLGVTLCSEFPEKRYDVIIDGIFGVGLKRDIAGIHKNVIEKINNSEAFVVAIDIPSGVNASTGRIMGIAIKADITVTCGLLKIGMVLYPGSDYCGKCVVKDIGFPEKSVSHVSPEIFTYDKGDLQKLPKRPENSNKGTFGKIAVIAGNEEISGAACLSALAAYETGAGMVKVYTHKENKSIIGQFLPEALIMTYEDEAEAFLCANDACAWSDVILIGPGIGTDTLAKSIVKKIFEETDKPIVADADCLNILSKDTCLLLNRKTKRLVITPHVKEMSRLTGESVSSIKEKPIEAARMFSKKYKLVCVLKDARTCVNASDDKTYVNMTGNSGMAAAGSGDVLAGIIAALIGMGLDISEASRLGVYVHGLAGDLAAEEYGKYGMTARDIAWKTAEVMKLSEKR